MKVNVVALSQQFFSKMKKQIFHLSSLALFVLLLSFAWSCKKESSEPAKTAPTGVTTSAATNISQTGATIAGTVGANGGSALTSRGVVYSKTNTTPTTDADDAELASGTDVGSFSVTLSGLDAKTKYYARAFATNSVGITYGSAINFTTDSMVANQPVVTSNATVSSITQTNASFGGNVTSDGGSPVTARGVCWNTSGGPTVSLSTKTTNGSGTGSFSSSITGLTAGTIYKVRAYATNANGTAYGEEVTFTTLAAVSVPVVSSNPSVSSITQTSAGFGGNVTSDGGSPVTARGVCWNTTGSPTVGLSTKTTDGSGTGSFSSSLTGLTAGTTYKVRAYATNANGTAYGNEVSFSTTSAPATVNITFRVNMTNETVSAQGVHIAGSFQNPAWQPGATPMTLSGSGIYTCTVAIPKNTTVEYKFINGNAWGNNENLPAPCGTSPDGNRTLNVGTTDQTVTFCYNSCNTSCPTPSITDFDGNVYQTVQIGTQIWMAENLKTSRYRNGDPIPTGLNNGTWQTTASGAYAIYDELPTNDNVYGKLYNWYAVADSRNLCPAGWHVPSDADWLTLEGFLGTSVGGKMKAVSNLWTFTNVGATNESGFSGLPGGSRGQFGNYLYQKDYGYWWTSSASGIYAVYRSLQYGSVDLLNESTNKEKGYSIRCIKN